MTVEHSTNYVSERFSNSPGFTLIEIMIAMAIFSIGMLAVGSMQISAINNNASARMRTEATMLASEKMEELMLADYAGLSDGPSVPLPSNTIYCYEWRVEDDYPIRRTATITLEVRWTDGETGCTNFENKKNEVALDFIRADI